MAKNKYKVTIKNWSKHQQKLKAGHSHFMFSKRFFDDESIADLKQNECLLYVNLLCIAADLMANSFVIHSKLMPNLLRIDDKSLENCLKKLMENQLVTYEKNDVLYNRIEKNRIEENRKEYNKRGGEKNEEIENQKLPSVRPNKVQSLGAIDEFSGNEICNNLLIKTKAQTQKAWISAYPSVPWIIHEMHKANVWISANSHKAPKNFERFFSTWLSKAFENYRKGLPSNGNKKTFDQLKHERNEEILREIQAEAENEN